MLLIGNHRVGDRPERWEPRARKRRPKPGNRLTQPRHIAKLPHSRLYKDGTQWKDSASFGRDDLPLVIKVADQAHNWIFNQSGSEA